MTCLRWLLRSLLVSAIVSGFDVPEIASAIESVTLTVAAPTPKPTPKPTPINRSGPAVGSASDLKPELTAGLQIVKFNVDNIHNTPAQVDVMKDITISETADAAAQASDVSPESIAAAGVAAGAAIASGASSEEAAAAGASAASAATTAAAAPGATPESISAVDVPLPAIPDPVIPDLTIIEVPVEIVTLPAPTPAPTSAPTPKPTINIASASDLQPDPIGGTHDSIGLQIPKFNVPVVDVMKDIVLQSDQAAGTIVDG